MIVANYADALRSSLVHKTIAFYLDHLADVDAYVAEHDRVMVEQMATARPGPTVGQLRARLEAKRKAEVRASELSS